jgi:hypothetical protein
MNMDLYYKYQQQLLELTVQASLTLKGPKPRKNLSVIFGKRIARRLHIETIAAKALRTFSIIYPLLKSERLSVATKLTLCKALIKLY